MSRIKRVKNSVLISWLVSYFSVLIIPIVISGMIFVVSSKIVEYEMNRANFGLMKQVQQTMDNYMGDVEKLGRQIALNKQLQGLLYGESLDSHQRYAITQIIKDFKGYGTTHGFINNFYVYLRNSNKILSPNSVYDTRIAYSLLLDDNNITYDQWIEMLQEVHSGEYRPIYVNKQNSDDIGVTMAYMQSLPLINKKEALATVVVLLNETRFQEAVENIQWLNQGTALIMDSNDNIIATTQQKDIHSYLNYSQLHEYDGHIYRTVNGEEVVISYIASDLTDWKYVSIIPKNIFQNNVRNIQRLTWLSIILCLVIGGVIAWYFTRKNYNPIQEIIRSLEKKEGIGKEKTSNEYSYIKELIHTTLDEKEKIEQKLKDQSTELRNSFLAKLLKGMQATNLPIEEVLSSYNITFDSEYFAVILFNIEDFSDLLNVSVDSEEYKYQLKLMRFIMADIIEKQVTKKHYGVVADVNEMMVCLVNIREDRIDHYKDDLYEAVYTGIQSIKQKSFDKYTVAISDIGTSIASIPTIYKNCVKAMEYKMMMDDRKVIYFDEVKMNRKSYYYPIEMEQRFINFIKVGNFNKSKEILVKIFEDNFGDKLLSIQMAKCLIFDLVSTMIKALDEISIVSNSLFLDELNPADRLLSCKTVAEMKKEMINISQTVCEYIQSHQPSQSEQLRDGIIQFVEKEYNNVNLSMTMIADEFSLTAAYLSKKFKEEMNESLIDYINKFRLEKAKKLLREQELSIADAAEQVGYNNSNAFIRAFKKYEGITPGKYKKL